MNVWLLPTSNVLINTFLRSLVVIAVMILGLNTTWYSAYWGAVVHDAISLIIVRPYV
jgi:ABC-type antimicrobial peptide transport system permease subunit